MRAFLLALSPLLMACSPVAGGSEGRDASTGSAPLDGRYRVVAVDQVSPVIGIAGSEPTVTIAGDRIHFQSQCVGADWIFRRSGQTLLTIPYHEPGSAMCARSLAPGEVAIQRALGTARKLVRIRGGLYLEGGGRTIQIERTPDPAEVAARAVDLRGEWRVKGIDGRPLEQPRRIELHADFETIWWEPECASQYRKYRMEGSAFFADPVSLSGGTVCDIGYPEELTEVWTALDAADTIERTTGGDVRIAGGGRSVLLSPGKDRDR